MTERSSSDSRWQLFPALPPTEYAALKADIAKRGVLVPIERDAETGELLDGHHRQQIVDELRAEGVEVRCPDPVERRWANDEERTEHVLKINLLRRHMDEVTWAEAFRRLADARGVELGKRGPKPKGKAKTATVAELAAEVGVNERTARHRLQTEEVLRTEPELEEKVRAKELSGTEAVKQKRQKAKREKRDTQAAALAAEPPPLPVGPFRLIVADPPWQYANRADDGTHRAANPYPSMSIADIRNLGDRHGRKVADVAAQDAVLWLWTTNSHLSEAFGVMEAWGFTYKTMLTWAKDRMGTGDWLRGQTEHCLLGIRGKPVWVLTNETTLLKGPLREHSAKPDEFYALVERLHPASAGNRCDLFARTPREGWVSFGDELPGAA